eukprot:comp19451_c0_seq2/m.36902 comp19451_c0_seq2/g.36902  ORF comp19451_c0_seq2/g.36902 comp19451_c0_seq2/m.36902 type:complete len:119 (+) comp19451_c0_seq2:57-413(+)
MYTGDMRMFKGHISRSLKKGEIADPLPPVDKYPYQLSDKNFDDSEKRVEVSRWARGDRRVTPCRARCRLSCRDPLLGNELEMRRCKRACVTMCRTRLFKNQGNGFPSWSRNRRAFRRN